jgi:tetratricopeptide (TPR) repeat protein
MKTQDIAIAGVLILFFINGCGSFSKTTEVTGFTDQREEARTLNAKVISEKENNYTQKQDVLEQALALDDLYGEAHNNLGVILYKQRKLYDAASQFQRSADLLPGNPIPLINLAILHAELKQWDRALAFARQAYKRDCHSIGAIEVLALCLVEKEGSDKELQPILDKLAIISVNEKWRKWAIKQKKAILDKSIK